jgi:hypothetical protein
MKTILVIGFIFIITMAVVLNNKATKNTQDIQCGSATYRGPAKGGTEILFICDKSTPVGSYITIGGTPLENSSFFTPSGGLGYRIVGKTPPGIEGDAPIDLRDSSGNKLKLFDNSFTYEKTETDATLIVKIEEMLNGTNWDYSRVKELLAQISKDSVAWKKKGERLVKQIEKKNETVEKRYAAAQLREKKKTGVSIGMTKQDVLTSSWGRPRSVNKTHTIYGTSEQWCYEGNNYLYFENDILVSIQN